MDTKGSSEQEGTGSSEREQVELMTSLGISLHVEYKESNAYEEWVVIISIDMTCIHMQCLVSEVERLIMWRSEAN